MEGGGGVGGGGGGRRTIWVGSLQSKSKAGYAEAAFVLKLGFRVDVLGYFHVEVFNNNNNSKNSNTHARTHTNTHTHTQTEEEEEEKKLGLYILWVLLLLLTYSCCYCIVLKKMNAPETKYVRHNYDLIELEHRSYLPKL